MKLKELKLEGKFKIIDSFKLSGRGIVLSGFIQDGKIEIGDLINFEKSNNIIIKEITGIEEIRVNQPNSANIGILIQCHDEFEIEEFIA